MLTCPVCEHTQAEGAECEVCGKKLLHGLAAIPQVPPVEGFEPTRHSDVPAAADPFPDLEPTAQAAADAPEDPAPDLDRGRADPVDVAGEPVPGLERTADAIPDDPRTAVPAIVSCRYCHTPASSGERVCARCGMRLPVYAGAADQGPVARRCGCGTAVTGPLCPTCGARMG
jgi:hypothetical protein